MARALLVAGLLVALSGSSAGKEARQQPDDGYSQEAARKWRALLHYQPHGGSTVLSERFFLTRRGARDPRAEWLAHRTAFANPTTRNAMRCRFPARYQLMKDELGWEHAPLHCPEFQLFRKKLDARALSVVFVAHDLSNPASAFGHALLFLGDPKEPMLFAHALGFEAKTGSLSALGYIPKGLAGGLRAGFLAEPLYTRTRRYERRETRSLWVFPLRFTEGEMQQLIRHVWELRGIEFPYGFFQGNCAQMLLGLLHAVAPSRELLPYSKMAILPSDVVRRLATKLGRAGPPIFRPSLEEQYAEMRKRLSASQRQQLQKLVKQRVVPESTNAEVLDAALVWGEIHLPHRSFRREGENSAHADHQWKRKILLARMALGASKNTEAPTRAGPSLLDSHLGSQVALAGGWSEERGAIARLSSRWLLHDSIDDPTGYPEFSTLEVGKLQLLAGRDQLVFDEFTLLRMASTGTSSPLISDIVWNFEVGARRLPLRTFSRVHAGMEATLGYGVSWPKLNLFAELGLRGGWLVTGATDFENLALARFGLLTYLPYGLRLRVVSEQGMSLHTRERPAHRESAQLRKRLAKGWDLDLWFERGPNRQLFSSGLVYFF